jgi:hypothetical protein
MLRGRERARGIRLAILLVSCALTTGLAGCNGPLPFLSGGELDGEERDAPSEWSLEEDFAVVPLETRPDDPYSVNIAYTQIDGRLYVNAGDTETAWVLNMEADPRVRMRVSDVLYRARAERVVDPAEISEFGRAWVDHSMFHRDPDSLDQVWVYRLVPR